MPAPVFHSEGLCGILRSYTSALIVSESVVAPSDDKVELATGEPDAGRVEDPDRDLRAPYENEVRLAFEGLRGREGRNFRVVFEAADGLVGAGDAIHGVAVQIPDVLPR